VSVNCVENANTRTAHNILKNFSNDTDMTQQKFISQLVIQDETSILSQNNKVCNGTNESVKSQNCHFVTLRNSDFSMSYANNRRPQKCTKYL